MHSDAGGADDTAWDQIVALYDQLYAFVPTPVVALNRAIAVAEHQGPEAGLAILDDLDLPQYHLLPAARADLLERLGRHDEAADAYEEAMALTENHAERDLLDRRRRELAVDLSPFVCARTRPGCGRRSCTDVGRPAVMAGAEPPVPDVVGHRRAARGRRPAARGSGAGARGHDSRRGEGRRPDCRPGSVGSALARLVDGELVERAGDGTHVLLGEAFRRAAVATADAGPPADPIGDAPADAAKVLRAFFRGGRLTSIPASHAKRLVILDRLAQELEPGVRYTERQVNAALRPFHEDVAALRRYLVDDGFLDRGADQYWRTGGSVNVR